MMISNTDTTDKMEQNTRRGLLRPRNVKQFSSNVERNGDKNNKESSNHKRNDLIPSILHCFNGVQKYKEKVLLPTENPSVRSRVRQDKLKPTRRKMA